MQFFSATKTCPNYYQSQARTEIGQRSLTCIGPESVAYCFKRHKKFISKYAFKVRYKAYMIDQYG